MRPRPYRWLAPLIALLLLTAWQSNRLAAIRRKGMPEAYVGYSTKVPAGISFIMVGMGGFRGIIAEVLWFRVSRLQEEGRFLELVQLAEWITALDPHAAEAWAYNAWNLAYNISVMMVRDEDRLRWVRHGVSLLRDHALRYNPREAKLYRELAWMYQNKIGDSLDSAHLAYKLDLARAMEPCVNPDGTLRDTPRTRNLLTDMRLQPERMLVLQQRLGPLDWRLAESHAIYWASQGLDCATGSERMLCQRALYQPLVLSVFHGRFTGDLANGEWRLTSNPGLAMSAATLMEQACQEFPSHNMQTLRLRFLANAIQHFHQRKEEELVRKLYENLVAALSAPLRPPSLEEVLRGWKPAEK